MTVKIEILDPQTEKPSTLRAVALFLNTLAADREGVDPYAANGSQSRNEVKAEVLGQQYRTQDTLPKSQTDGPDAPGASADLTPPPPPPVNAAADSPSSNLGELDVNGLPWDGRIHASTKGKNQDGSWKALRGVDKTIVPGIEAELRAKLADSEPAADAPPPPPPVATPAADAPPPPPPVVEEQEDSAPVAVTAASVFKRITELKKENRIDQDGIDAALSSVDVESLAAFMKLAKDDAGLPELVLDALNAIAGSE